MSAHSTGNSPERGPRFVLSLHDVTPSTRESFNPFIRDAAKAGVERTSLLVVPRWHGGPSFTRDEKFIVWLKELESQGHDISLHGFQHVAVYTTHSPLTWFMHRIYTAGEDEFYRISEEEALHKLKNGLEAFKGVGIRVVGFTAPAWLMSREARSATIRAGFEYTTTFSTVELLKTRRCLRAPTLVFSTRKEWRRAVSKLWVPLWKQMNKDAPVLRLAMHPRDLEHRDIRKIALNMIEEIASTHTPCTYRDLLPDAPADQEPHATAEQTT